MLWRWQSLRAFEWNGGNISWKALPDGRQEVLARVKWDARIENKAGLHMGRALLHSGSSGGTGSTPSSSRGLRLGRRHASLHRDGAGTGIRRTRHGLHLRFAPAGSRHRLLRRRYHRDSRWFLQSQGPHRFDRRRAVPQNSFTTLPVPGSVSRLTLTGVVRFYLGATGGAIYRDIATATPETRNIDAALDFCPSSASSGELWLLQPPYSELIY